MFAGCSIEFFNTPFLVHDRKKSKERKIKKGKKQENVCGLHQRGFVVELPVAGTEGD